MEEPLLIPLWWSNLLTPPVQVQVHAKNAGNEHYQNKGAVAVATGMQNWLGRPLRANPHSEA